MRVKREVPDHIKEKIHHVGQKIATIRKSRSLTREKLAYGIGIAKSYLGYIERGMANPSLETLLLISEGLDIDLADLL